MNERERQEWKERARTRMEQFVRAQIAACERVMGPQPGTARPEQLEEIRRGIKEQARAYLAVMRDPLDDEKFALTMEAFDEIVDSVIRSAIH